MPKENKEFPFILKVSFEIPAKSNKIEQMLFIINYMINNQENEKEDIKNYEINSLKYKFIEKD